MSILDRLLCRWLGDPQPYGTPGARVVNIRRGSSETYLRRFRLVDQGELAEGLVQRAANWLANHFGHLVIGVPGRYNVYLHEVFRSDDDDDPHDHPWPWWTLILRGGYVDEQWETPVFVPRRVSGYEAMTAGSFRRREAGHLHRLRLFPGQKGPTWTLVVIGEKVRSWGFVTSDVGWMDWECYTKERQGKRAA